jgi:3-oxoacyl-[acyl-carrier-protein] synthase I
MPSPLPVHPATAAPLRAFIRGAGAATSLGRLSAAAAAARAGITRFAPVPGLVLLDDESGEPVPLVGAPAHPLTQGFESEGRVVRLMIDALADLLERAGDGIDWSSTGIFVALSAPPPAPPVEPATDLSEEELGPDEYGPPEPDVAEAPPVASPVEIARSIVRTSFDAHGIDAGLLRHLDLGERLGALAALRVALESLERKLIGQAIVVAADSLIDGAKLAHWARQPNRLKTANSPVGFMPGEAAVALLLGARGGPDDCTLHSALLEEEGIAGAPASPGRALARVLESAAAQLGTPPATIYLDLNGEEDRATEWGAGVARLPPASPLRNAALQLPATAFGETGAAGPLLAVALATRAWARGHAAGASCVVLCHQASGTRAAFGVERREA